MTVFIRTVSEADLEPANEILRSAFQRAENWAPELRLFLRLQPDGMFLASSNGIPAGMVASIIYSDYAYVGMMGIHQDFQRQGLGHALMEHLLTWMEEQRVPLVKLDASQAGQPLYEKLGFVPLEEVYVFQRPADQVNGKPLNGIRLMSHPHLELVNACDTQVFGADRSRLLHALLDAYPARALISQKEQGQVSGYLFAQPKRIGPWIMEESCDAEGLLLSALSLPFKGTVSVVTPVENVKAVSLLKRFGFEIVRVNRHMAYRTVVSRGRREKVFGQTSLSLG